MDTLSSRLTSLHQRSEDMMTKGYEQVVISFAAAFVKLIFRSVPEEKNLDKPPPPKIQSPKNERL